QLPEVIGNIARSPAWRDASSGKLPTSGFAQAPEALITSTTTSQVATGTGPPALPGPACAAAPAGGVPGAGGLGIPNRALPRCSRLPRSRFSSVTKTFFVFP